MSKFAAFLRGINIGGHKKVPMSELKKTFEKIGLKNVKTLLASGNVVFDGNKKLTNSISGTLEKTFGFPIETIIIPFETIDEIIESNPFKNVKITPKIRLYITFMKEKQKTRIKTPFSLEDNSFQIIKVTDSIIFSVLDLEKTGTTEGMGLLEKEFGKQITTRNYNTIVKLAKL